VWKGPSLPAHPLLRKLPYKAVDLREEPDYISCGIAVVKKPNFDRNLPPNFIDLTIHQGAVIFTVPFLA
jgi:hypothetical protein